MGLPVFEADLLSAFIKDEKKFIKFSGRLKEKHFSNRILRWMYKVLADYYNKYRSLPSVDVFKEEIMKTSFNEDLKKHYMVVVKKVFKRKIKTNLRYLEDNVSEKIEKEEFLIAIDRSLKSIESGNLSIAKKELLKEAILSPESEGDKVVRIIKDWEMRQVARKELSKIPISKRFISTPYPVINSVTHGIQVSEGATVAGLTGNGKSLVAGEFGTNSLLEGLNVLHFTLENMAEQTAQRYDSRISEIEYDTIKLYKFKNKELEHFKKIFKALSSSMKNDVVVKETVKDETDITLVDRTVETLKYEGFNTEFLIIDSCDLMSSTRRYEQHRLERASIYWDFKFYLKAKRLPGLTTTQLKAVLKKDKKPTAEDLAESYDKARILDIVYILSQDEDQKKDNIVEFIVDKNRDGPKGASVLLYKDFSRMRFLELL